jgi:EAL domain-containing protein (putative c-di-GMP-specific phosphodiesterase class I)
LQFLTESGCQEMQGFHFSKPLSATDFENLLTNHIV